MKNVQESFYDLPSRVINLRELMGPAGTLNGFNSLETLRYSESINTPVIQAQSQNRQKISADFWLSSSLYL